MSYPIVAITAGTVTLFAIWLLGKHVERREMRRAAARARRMAAVREDVATRQAGHRAAHAATGANGSHEEIPGGLSVKDELVFGRYADRYRGLGTEAPR